MGYVMEWIFDFLGVFGIANIGLTIIIFTIIIKLIMIPMSINQQKFTKMNAVMAPEIQAIQNKYKGKKDQESIMKQNEEQRMVYQKYGVKPSGSCLQMLIQIPIIFGLYRVVWNIPAYVTSLKNVYLQIIEPLQKIKDYHLNEEFIKLATSNSIKASDVANVENTNKLVDMMYNFDATEWEKFIEIFKDSLPVETIRELIDKISGMNNFLGINLANAPSYYGLVSFAILIPLLAGLTQWLSTKAMQSGQNQPKKDGDSENVMMGSLNMMTKIMPIMSIIFCYTLPSAIGVYWVISSLCQLVIQLALNAYMNRLDVNELVKQNIEKQNKKREKRGLPPNKITTIANTNVRNVTVPVVKEANPEEKAKKIQSSTEYYQKDAKPGSLASKANMVQKYNEKNKK